MTTLMTFTTKENKKGKCDARCYDAKYPECVCCCGGINHGVGFKKAFKNTIDHFEEMVKNAKNVKRNKELLRQFRDLKNQYGLFKKESEKDTIARLED